MSSIFYPVVPFSCPWGAWGSCRFCGIPFMEKVLVPQMPTQKKLRLQFDSFVNNPRNAKDIKRHKRIAIAPNGSVVPEVPKYLRDYILAFCKKHNLCFESELIATLIDQERTYALYDRAYKKKNPELSDLERHEKVISTLTEIDRALNEEFPNSNVLLNIGIEVANSDDLKTLHKYTHDLNDFVACAEYLHVRGIKVGANILVGAPFVEDSVRKALETVRFAFEEMRADKILLITWNPVKSTVAKKQYDKGNIDVLSATQSAEIYHVAREQHPDKEIEFNRMRAHIFHGKHPNFRDGRINTEVRKIKARKVVRDIAVEVFA